MEQRHRRRAAWGVFVALMFGRGLTGSGRAPAGSEVLMVAPLPARIEAEAAPA